MANQNRSWLEFVFGEQKKAAKRGKPLQHFRVLRCEFLEPRLTLSGAPTFAQMLAAATPDPHPTGAQPPSASQLVYLSDYSMPTEPNITTGPTKDFFDSLQAIYENIAANPAARPSVWVENVPTAADEVRLYINDNGMLTGSWSFTWGDGTTSQVASPQPWIIHQYAAPGDYTISVTANSPDGPYSTPGTSFADYVGIGTGSSGLDASFADVAPTLHVAPAQTVAAGQVFSLTNMAGVYYPSSPPNPITASADWGDGSNPDNLIVTTTAAGGVGEPYLAGLSGQHVFTIPGTYYVAISAANGSLSDEQEIPVTVVPLTTTISGLNSGNTYNEGDTASLAGDLSDGTTDFSESGAPVTYNWQVQDNSGNVLFQTTDPTLNYTFGDDGTYVISLTASLNGVTGTTDTETISVNPVAPVIPTSSTTINVSANVGQTVTLPPISFTQAGLGDVHTATANWADGTGVDTSPQVTEETSDGTTVTPGSVTASHVFTAANTYSVSVTVTNDAGLTATQNFSVTVTGATVSLGTFMPSSDGSQFELSYTIADAAAAPFNINLYTSPDGTAPSQLLMSVPIDGTTYPLDEGPHTISFTPSFTDPQQDYHLIAVSDADGSRSTVEFAGGAFYATDPTVSSAAAYVYAFGSSAGSTPIDVGTSTITVGGVSYPIPANATAVHVRAENPGNTITVDPSMTLQCWQYADGVQDTLTVTPDNSVPLTNLVMDNFAMDANGVPAVTFTNNGEDAPPFSIGILSSSDGLTPSTLVGTIDVSDPTDLTGGGTHTLEYDGDLGALNGSQDYFIAVLDWYNQVTETSKSDNTSAPLSGAFQNSDGSVDVLGTGTSGTISLANDADSGNVVVSGVGTTTTFIGVTSVYVAAYGGTDTVDGSGLNAPMMVYGGSGYDTIYGGAVSNWIQAGSGGATIYGGSGNDWLYGGAGNNAIYGGSGTEMIYGGSGSNTLVGGTGLDDIYGGSGTNFIYGNGQHDRLWGGSGQNYIDPTGGGGLATVKVVDHNSAPTIDGNIDASGSAYTGDYAPVDPTTDNTYYPSDPGYGGTFNPATSDLSAVPNWNLTGFDSGVRLGEETTTPVAVYADWQNTGTNYGTGGTHWSTEAYYFVYVNGVLENPDSTPLNQESAPPADAPQNNSPEDTSSSSNNDRPWDFLGVWNVPAGATITVVLVNADTSYGTSLCMSDVMVHAIWPTVTIRADANGDGALNTKDDAIDSFQPVQVPIEGTGSRTQFALNATVETLYASIPGASMSDWQASLSIAPSGTGLELWTASTGGDPLSDTDFSSMISSGNYGSNVWVSSISGEDPDISLIFANAAIGAQPAANAKVAVTQQAPLIDKISYEMSAQMANALGPQVKASPTQTAFAYQMFPTVTFNPSAIGKVYYQQNNLSIQISDGNSIFHLDIPSVDIFQVTQGNLQFRDNQVASLSKAITALVAIAKKKTGAFGAFPIGFSINSSMKMGFYDVPNLISVDLSGGPNAANSTEKWLDYTKTNPDSEIKVQPTGYYSADGGNTKTYFVQPVKAQQAIKVDFGSQTPTNVGTMEWNVFGGITSSDDSNGVVSGVVSQAGGGVMWQLNSDNDEEKKIFAKAMQDLNVPAETTAKEYKYSYKATP